jgi:hypothetical protein
LSIERRIRRIFLWVRIKEACIIDVVVQSIAVYGQIFQ